MRNTGRSRTIAIIVFLLGVSAIPIAFQLPEAINGDLARAGILWLGMLCAVFGGLLALFYHLDLRAKQALTRADELLAQWRISPDDIQRFLAHQETLPPEPVNELPIPASIPPEGLEIRFGKNAIQVGNTVYRLPRRGLPEVLRAALFSHTPGGTYLELRIYYPPQATGSSRIRPERHAVLRIPITQNACPAVENGLAYYNAGRPGKADFFHGKGDGTNSEDLSICWKCGLQTYQFRSRCPKCGATLQSRRWARRFGALLILCGLAICIGMGVVIENTVPSMLGIEQERGMRFTGTRTQAAFILGIFALVSIFGLTTLCYGFFQVLTGRRNHKAVALVVGIAVVLYAISKLL